MYTKNFVEMILVNILNFLHSALIIINFTTILGWLLTAFHKSLLLFNTPRRILLEIQTDSFIGTF